MTLLTVWDENNASTPELQTRDAAVITEVLGTLGASLKFSDNDGD
jgi:1,2-dihydroxy-3-keto-5-methylthiopentene dioxygenase